MTKSSFLSLNKLKFQVNFYIYLIFRLREWTDTTFPTAADHAGNHDIFAGYLSLFLFNSFLYQSCHLNRVSYVEIGVDC